ncbi:MAG: S9 family peptidase, partial [Prevotella bivia]|nr:S9 family peptidase [Prevotella bivia]
MKKKTLIGMMLLASPTITMAQNIIYPAPPSDNTVDKYFGIEVNDPYRPLESDTAQATLAWVKAENKITTDYLSKIPFRAKLLNRMKELANYEKYSAPWYNKHTQ